MDQISKACDSSVSDVQKITVLVNRECSVMQKGSPSSSQQCRHFSTMLAVINKCSDALKIPKLHSS